MKNLFIITILSVFLLATNSYAEQPAGLPGIIPSDEVMPPVLTESQPSIEEIKDIENMQYFMIYYHYEYKDWVVMVEVSSPCGSVNFKFRDKRLIKVLLKTKEKAACLNACKEK